MTSHKNFQRLLFGHYIRLMIFNIGEKDGLHNFHRTLRGAILNSH